MGHADIQLAGFTVKNQTIGFITESHFPGAPVFSGTLSMAAYKADTSAFKGTNFTLDNQDHNLEYDPLFRTMIKQGLVAPLFSLAVMRTNSTEYIKPHGGYIAFGGLPPVSFDPVFGSTPIQIVCYRGWPLLTTETDAAPTERNVQPHQI